MTKSQMGEDGALLVSDLSRCPGTGKTAVGEVILGVDFKSKRRGRIYDANKIWSGEHTILDYTEL